MALTAGSIAFTGFNGDGNDNLSFVALTDIPQGTVINFTDSNWNGSSFASGSNSESTIAWTATTAIPAGTVIDINNIGKGTFGASAGSVTFTNANNTGLSNDSEVVYAYVGSASAPTFLAAISNVGYATSDGTLTGTGLAAGQTAVSFTGGLDIVGYNGPRSGLTSFADYLAAIGNTANWQTQNGSGDQSTDGTAPNAPFPTTAFTVVAPAVQSISFSPSSVSVTEGDSGTKIMTFTVVRSGGTTGTISFSGSFAAGTTNAADFGGTLPNPTFAGSLADGVNSATVTITISGDAVAESDESFTLTLTSASNPGATVTIGTATATGTIANDDGTLVSGNSSNPITLANNDHLTVLAGVTLSGSTPVTWIGGSTSPGSLVDNSGTISGTSRGIYTSGSTSGSFTINNETGATITATKDAVKISNLVSGTSGTFTVNNEGTISSTGTGSNAGQALDLDDVNSSGVQTVITNAATGVISAADADAIRPGANATINNYGQIVSHNASAASSGNDAIDFQSVNTGGVVNNFAGGLIDGARHGITGDQPITVNNDGTITGEAGAGINMDTAATTTTSVTNRGTITGISVNGADADGIDVDGLVSIDNFGTIKAVGLTGAANGLNEALAIGGGFVHNEVGGLIVSDQRAITVDDSDGGSAFGVMTIVNDGTINGQNGEAISITGEFADTVTNTGSIVGSVDLGGGNDTLTNSGTITGNVLMGAGDDSIAMYAGSSVTGTIDGGAGNDTLHLASTAAATLQTTVTGVEHLVVQSGIWDVGQTTGYADIDVQKDALVTNSVYLTGSQQLKVEAGGTIGNGTDVGVRLSGTLTAASIDNAGTIHTIGSAYLSNPTGAVTIVNETTGLIADGLQLFGTITQSAPAIDNFGQIIGSDHTSTIAITLENATGTGARIVNEAGGLIATVAYQDVIRGGNGTVVENHGTIRSSADQFASDGELLAGGDAVDYKKMTSGVVHNYGGGLIEGSHHAVTGKKGMTVVNDAGGTMIGRNGSAVNVDNKPTVADTVSVTNRGVMEGRSAGYDDSDGDAIDVDGLVSVENWGQIKGEGANGYHNGTEATDANISEGIAIGGGTIANHTDGLIYGYGRGIQVDNSSNGQAFAATIITNEGTIEGGGHGPTGVSAEHAAFMQARIDGAEAINIIGDFDDTITNAATGKIIGGIFTDGGDDTLSNDGTITAMAGSAVNLGDGDDLLINRGTITGAVQTGAGNDEIITTSTGIFDGAVSMGDGDDKLGNSGKITGTVDMGAGDDVVNLYIGTNVTGTIQLGTGNDRLTADMYQSQSFTVDAGDGDDLVTTSFGNDVIHGGAGNDTIYASDGDDQAFGNDGDDLLVGEAGFDLLDGGAGNDRILAGAGDTVLGDAGDDTIELTDYRGTPASIDGGDGNDTLVLTGTGTGALLGTIVHVEKLDIQSGIWRIKDAAGYTDITVASGAGVVLEGSADGMVVAAGAVLSVYGSAANSVISGNQYIQIGGSADGTTIAAGGEQDIYGGGTATNTNVDGGTQTVFGVAIGTTIANGGIQHVHNNVFSTIVNDGGEQNVYVDGSATGTTVNAGGLQIDWGFTITTTINGGHQFVFGSATLTTINSGVQTVQSGGTASETTIHGGEQDVYSGGTAINTTMDGGSQAVYGTVTQTIIGNGAIQYLHGTASLTTVNAGSQQNVYADGFAAGTTINAGGYQLDWGAASGTIVNGGEQYVFGSAIGTTVLAGVQHVQSGGSADDTTIGAGALAYVHAGGTIDDVVFAGGNASLVLDQASSFTGTISGWQDHDSVVLGDILFSDGITSLAYAANGDNSGGTLTVSDGTHTATLNLLGQYSAADFALSSDGHGGTLISDPGVVQQSQLAATLHG